MRKLLTAIILTACFYLVPLLGNPGLILDPRILTLIVAALVLLLTQPALSTKEARGRRADDRYSVLIIMGVTALVQIISVLEWAYADAGLFSGGKILTTLAATLLLMGILLRLWAIRELGRFFTATVYIAEDQQIITSGPFTIVRHPSYLGAYLAVIGSALLLGSFWGTLLGLVGLFGAYHHRIAAEEKAMLGAFGESYRAYQTRTQRMIPFVW